MPNVVFQMIAFNADAFLEPVLESILPYGKVIVTEGPVAYWQARGYTTSADRTNEILADMVGEENIIHGQFAEKDEMMRAAEQLIPRDTTHVWMVDTDELYPQTLIEKVLRDLDGLDSIEFKPNTFYGGFDRILQGFEVRAKWQRIQRWHAGASWHTHRPPTVLAPDGKPYHTKRHAAYLAENFFHYSYVNAKQVRDKIQYYESWGAGVIESYMARVYLPWVNGNLLQKAHIECEFKGVHEWNPARRGDCFTKEFTGTHPEPIARRMIELKARLERELAEMREGRI